MGLGFWRDCGLAGLGLGGIRASFEDVWGVKACGV